jgi:hypothetical protein
MVRKVLISLMPTLRQLTEGACNDPRRMRARKTEAEIIEKMSSGAWLSCTAVSRLICVPDDRKIRARPDRLVHDGRIERKLEQGNHGACLSMKLTNTLISPAVIRRRISNPSQRVSHTAGVAVLHTIIIGLSLACACPKMCLCDRIERALGRSSNLKRGEWNSIAIPFD